MKLTDNKINLMACRNCPFLKNNLCWLSKQHKTDCDECYYLDIGHNLDNHSAAKVLHYFNKWRRGGKGNMVSGLLVGMAIDKALQSLRKGIRNGD